MVRNTLILRKLQQALPLLFFLLIAAKSLLILPACKPGNMAVDANADTTSHNFAFQIDTLGDGNSSLLNDVCIIDENNIWAVGEIYFKDVSGQFNDPPYNAARWDGQKWNLIRIPTRIWNTNTFITAPLKTIIAFGPNDIWVTTGGQVIRYNGQDWGQWQFLFSDLNDNTFGGINKFWGTSNSQLWGGGNKGNIFHFNGSTWQKLSSGTTVDIQDIWGAVDGKTGQQTILAVASYRAAVPQDKQLLRIQNNTVSILSDAGLPFDLSGIWFTVGERYFVVGDGVYYSDVLGNLWQSDSSHPLLYKDAIRGLAQNDIFITGSFGLVSHYNGATWKHYTGSELPPFYGRYKAASYKGNLLIAVGWFDEQAVILRGMRR